MIDESFATGTSFLHRRDARVKIIGATAISLVLALSNSFTAAGAGFFCCLILLFISQPRTKQLLTRIASVNVFSLFLLISLPLTYGGENILQTHFMDISLDGLRLACLITLKCNAILFCFLALLATSTTPQLGHALEALHAPRKLILLLLFSYHQLFVIHKEYQRLQRAARLRGFIAANSLHTYRTYSHLFGMTLVKSWNRAQRVQQAMVLRGFTGRFIALSQPHPGRSDYSLLILLLLISLLLAGLSSFPLAT
jgi:cobalt/nickel transport system permease protein